MPGATDGGAARPDRIGASMAAELVPSRGRGSTVRGTDGPLVVYRSGMGAPVLLVHGLTSSALSWHRVVPALARRYEVIAVDARGHGRSALAGAAADRLGYSTRDHAADLVAVLDRLGIARASLLGQSMGAENVACCAARHPDRVTCVVLEDPPWWPLPQAPLGARRAMRREWHAQLLAERRLPRRGAAGAARRPRPRPPAGAGRRGAGGPPPSRAGGAGVAGGARTLEPLRAPTWSPPRCC